MTTSTYDGRVAMRSTTITLAIGLLLCAFAVSAQQADLYSQITPLETAINNGTATRAQQLDLARLYIQTGRFYEAQTITEKLLAADPNDADAKAIRDQALNGIRDVGQRKVAEAEANAHRSGALLDGSTKGFRQYAERHLLQQAYGRRRDRARKCENVERRSGRCDSCAQHFSAESAERHAGAAASRSASRITRSANRADWKD